MRRNEKEIKDRETIDAIIRQASVCRLALADENEPYLVPVSFGYEDNTIYFHSSTESGHKMDILKKNNLVCFEMDIDTRIVVGENACNWSMKYLSVIGTGHAQIVNDHAEKIKGFNAIMRHYNGPQDHYDETSLKHALIVKIPIETITGKKSGY